MNDQQIIEQLQATGHLTHPFGVKREVPHDVLTLPITHPLIEQAMQSYQDFSIVALDPLVNTHHCRAARCDGVTGPATRELFELPRCGTPDYGDDVQPAMGTGSWQGCHGVGDFHAATVFIHEPIPSHLQPYWKTIWGNTVTAYDDLGLQFTQTRDKAAANIDLSFRNRLNGAIGLAIVGRDQACDSQVWCRFLSTYKPASLVEYWSRLVIHEIAHNAGLLHVRSGIMAPYISAGRVDWKGDPSEPILRKLFGGEPVGGTPPPPVDPPGDKPTGTLKVTLEFPIDKNGGLVDIVLPDGQKFSREMLDRAT